MAKVRQQLAKSSAKTSRGGPSNSSRKAGQVRDARERLTKKSTSSGDARDKIVKIRNLKAGKLNVSTTAGGRVEKVTTTSGKLVLTTASKVRAKSGANARGTAAIVKRGQKVVKKSQAPLIKSPSSRNVVRRVSGQGSIVKVANDRRISSSRNVPSSASASRSSTLLQRARGGAGGVRVASPRKPLRRPFNRKSVSSVDRGRVRPSRRAPPVGHPLDRFGDVRSPRQMRTFDGGRDMQNQFRSSHSEGPVERVHSRSSFSDSIRGREQFSWNESRPLPSSRGRGDMSFDMTRRAENNSALYSRQYVSDSVGNRMQDVNGSMGSGGGGGNSANNNAGAVVVVSNLQSTVSRDDIIELFSDVGPLVRVTGMHRGSVDVVFANTNDARQSVQVYHNRQLDGCAMKCVLLESPW